MVVLTPSFFTQILHSSGTQHLSTGSKSFTGPESRAKWIWDKGQETTPGSQEVFPQQKGSLYCPRESLVACCVVRLPKWGFSLKKRFVFVLPSSSCHSSHGVIWKYRQFRYLFHSLNKSLSCCFWTQENFFVNVDGKRPKPHPSCPCQHRW